MRSKKLSMMVLALAMFLCPLPAAAANNVSTNGSAVTYRVYVDGTLNQTSSIRIGATSGSITSKTEFQSASRSLTVRAVSRGAPTNAGKPNISSFPAQGSVLYTKNRVSTGANAGTYCYLEYSAPMQGTTGYQLSSYKVKAVTSNEGNKTIVEKDNTHEGIVLNYWYQGNVQMNIVNGGIVTYTSSSGSTFASGCYLNLYYTKKSYTLTFNVNGGNSLGTNGSRTVKYQEAYGSLPTPTRTDHEFLGWFTSASGGTQVSDSTTMGAGDTTVYAHWGRDQYTVRFDPNGGTGTMADQKINTNQAAGLNRMSGLARTGFTFKGWADRQLTNKVTYADGGQVNSLGPKNSTVILYAVWQREGSGFKQPPALVSHGDMFIKDEHLTGGAGTPFNSAWVTGDFAHVDKSARFGGKPGYFTLK